VTKIMDNKGVTWIEVPIKKEFSKDPVDAFGKTSIGTLAAGAALGTAAGGIDKMVGLYGEQKKAGTPSASKTLSAKQQQKNIRNH
jgi:hypothetical protein